MARKPAAVAASLPVLLGMLLLLPGGSSEMETQAGAALCQTLLKVNPAFSFPVDNKMCSALGLSTPGSPIACSALETFSNFLQSIKLGCKQEIAAPPPTTDPSGTLLPQTLPDRRVNGKMSNAFANVEGILQAEGATYWWLSTLMFNLMRISPCFLPDSSTNGSSVQLPVPAGWILLSVLNLTQTEDMASNGKLKLPFAAIFKPAAAGKAARVKSCKAWARKPSSLMRNSVSNATRLCDGDQLVIAIRGTITKTDVVLDVSYNQVTDAKYGPGPVHSGVKKAADELWTAGIQAALRQHVVRGGGAVRHVTFVGYSLGGGVAQLLAVRAQIYLKTACAKEPAWQSWPDKAPVVTAVLAAPINAGSPAFADYLNSNVNVRRIIFEYDPVPQALCIPALVACPANTVPTGGPGITTIPFGAPGGQLLLKASAMPFATADPSSDIPAQPWSSLSTLTGVQLCNATVGAAVAWQMHACSYSCKLSQYVADKSTSSCIIDNKTGANAAASVCRL